MLFTDSKVRKIQSSRGFGAFNRTIWKLTLFKLFEKYVCFSVFEQFQKAVFTGSISSLLGFCVWSLSIFQVSSGPFLALQGRFQEGVLLKHSVVSPNQQHEDQMDDFCFHCAPISKQNPVLWWAWNLTTPLRETQTVTLRAFSEQHFDFKKS